MIVYVMSDLKDIEQQLKAVASARRLEILAFLKKEHTAIVGDIADAVHISMVAVSQHLRILRAAKIVTYKKRGLYVSYRLLIPQKQPIKQVIASLK